MPLYRVAIALAAFVSCTSPRTPAPAAPLAWNGRPVDYTSAAQPCTQYVDLASMHPRFELHAPVACGNDLEHYLIVIGADGHVISVGDTRLRFPNAAAVREIKSWVFQPMLVDGIPTTVCADINRRAPASPLGPRICPAT